MGSFDPIKFEHLGTKNGIEQIKIRSTRMIGKEKVNYDDEVVTLKDVETEFSFDGKELKKISEKEGNEYE
eukprot:CAMPEP_0114590756 /NCGR_PEP_ID=MMETSP0125-20121206/12959_1 /TAXON_ID=485358 ORGANISM="Aristerostoma sp., Strain ATCC 50986" /NCGR_SAMPLE_ID=MMETSP0125 /ASSEMBLY_ACC=CAM_ASM_000245 /LENGTH=69 /DNA_ID=CAMNT_0001788471 /DNA_START=349 /DNA_END=558 /DNA_ORIENTATION=-